MVDKIFGGVIALILAVLGFAAIMMVIKFLLELGPAWCFVALMVGLVVLMNKHDSDSTS